MFHCSAHRVPRAGLDRIDTAEAALAVIGLATHRPHRHETIVVLLDHERCGVALTVVAHTTPLDAVVEVVECIGEAAVSSHVVDALVLASVRPDAVDCAEGDADRWLEMSDLTESIGLELVEWFVIGAGVRCPRDLLGEPPRW